MTGPPDAAGAGRLLSRPARPSEPPVVEPGVRPLGLPGRGDALLVVPPGAPRPSPLLVFFHGAGGAAAGSLPVVRDAVAARAVLALLPTSAGSTWDLVAGGARRDVAALDVALTAVFDQHAIGPVAFAGFSDGASYALSLGLANGDLCEAVLAFSPGFVAPLERVGRPRAWVSHGTRDAVLPVDRCGRRVVRLLGDAGYDVTYEEFDGGHVVSPELVSGALGWWLGR